MSNKLPSRFKNLVNEKDDPCVRAMQNAYNQLSHLLEDLNRDCDSDMISLIKEHAETRVQLAKSIELFYGGICEEEFENEVFELKRKLESAQDVVIELQEQLELLTS